MLPFADGPPGMAGPAGLMGVSVSPWPWDGPGIPETSPRGAAAARPARGRPACVGGEPPAPLAVALPPAVGGPEATAEAGKVLLLASETGLAEARGEGEGEGESSIISSLRA